jgi:hypothetical protein
MTCDAARHNASRISYSRRHGFKPNRAGSTCKTLRADIEFADVRCTKVHGTRRFRFQAGASFDIEPRSPAASSRCRHNAQFWAAAVSSRAREAYDDLTVCAGPHRAPETVTGAAPVIADPTGGGSQR